MYGLTRKISHASLCSLVLSLSGKLDIGFAHPPPRVTFCDKQCLTKHCIFCKCTAFLVSLCWALQLLGCVMVAADILYPEFQDPHCLFVPTGHRFTGNTVNLVTLYTDIPKSVDVNVDEMNVIM